MPATCTEHAISWLADQVPGTRALSQNKSALTRSPKTLNGYRIANTFPGADEGFKCCTRMNDTGAHPIGDQVLLRRVEPERMLHGLHLPDGAEQWPAEGVVLEVGQKVKTKEIVAGARVLFKSRPASALIRDDWEADCPPAWKRVVVLKEDDILCIIER